MARWDKEGNKESIPDWFWEAIDVEPVTKTVEVDECDVSYRHYAVSYTHLTLPTNREV